VIRTPHRILKRFRTFSGKPNSKIFKNKICYHLAWIRKQYICGRQWNVYTDWDLTPNSSDTYSMSYKNLFNQKHFHFNHVLKKKIVFIVCIDYCRCSSLFSFYLHFQFIVHLSAIVFPYVRNTPMVLLCYVLQWLKIARTEKINLKCWLFELMMFESIFETLNIYFFCFWTLFYQNI